MDIIFVLEPTTFCVSSNTGVPIRADHRHREDKHPIAISSSTVGQKEFRKKARAGTREGENMAPPRKIARTDSRELNEDS
ncbi:hypothetical protein F7725_011684 [Dissostichus mawsoni]|uniref:Uncharacterized protein n=1 Tax=Dissostichus mawsoni TaxID=36200 RepID=A0A7J5ZAB6_DISMA|nr:hypothetical protein F7725_011684 [Dissostichus mawsoni]